MSHRILTITSTAVAMFIAGPLAAQTSVNANASVEAEAETDIAAQANDAAEEIGETVYAIGETATDTAQAGVEAAGETAEDAYGTLADIAARIDASATGDLVVRSSDGEVLGTVYRIDASSELVIIDLDGQMEGADERAIENAGVSAGSLQPTEDGLMLNMTEAEFAAALQTGAEASLSSDG